jgi:hypothetical protein
MALQRVPWNSLCFLAFRDEVPREEACKELHCSVDLVATDGGGQDLERCAGGWMEDDLGRNVSHSGMATDTDEERLK